MATLDTIDKIAHQLLLHCPLAGKPLATVWATNAWDTLAGRYDRWSWRIKFGQIAIPAVYSTGTISITSADPTLVIGVGTTFTPEMVGRQLFSGTLSQFDIVEYVDATHVRLALPWKGADISGAAYEILQQYVVMPEDFAGFISVIDPTQNKRLRHNIERREIDSRDPRRTSRGEPYVLAEAGYGPTYAGSVDSVPFQVRGSGAAPIFGGAYSGPVDTIYTVEIILGGASGVATFRWRRGTGAWSATTTTDSAGVGLSANVVAVFPAGTYVLGDIFVSRARSVASFGLVRYELWPTQSTQIFYPYYYYSTPPNLSTLGATLPRTIPGRVVLKGALAEAVGWAGRGSEKNPMYDLKAATTKMVEFEHEVDLLVLRDDEMFPKSVSYGEELPFAGPPWSAAWEQVHA